MGAVAAADVLAGPGFGLLPLLSLGPALAAVSLRPVHTALVGGLTLVLCLLLAVYDDLLESRRTAIALATIAGVTAAGMIANAGRHRRERELADMTAVAEVAQRVLLHPVPREVGPLQVAVRYISASAAARIGGDLYEVIPAGQAVRLIVADVQGKGLAAVQTAALVLGAFREAAYDAAGLAEIAAQVECSLLRQAAAEEFVTAVLAQISDGRPAIEILNCGHPPPLLLSGHMARFIEPCEACCHSAWPSCPAGRARAPPSTSARASGCSSTPMASAKRGTGQDSSIRLTSAAPCSTARSWEPHWTGSVTTSSATSGTTCATTPRRSSSARAAGMGSLGRPVWRHRSEPCTVTP